MLKSIRKYKKTISLFLVWVMTQGIFLESALALTSGPETPESSGFSPAGLDNLVDPFTGDFSYNVDLLNVGGFPVNIAYSSGVTPDTEASWVGLGWNLNVGSISRSKRGLPDDFAGDQVKKEYNTKPNQTFGVTGNMSFEAYGSEVARVGLNADLSYNTYKGFGLSVGYSPSVNSSKALKSSFTGSLGINASLGSESGLSVSPKLGLSYKQDKDKRETTLNSSLSFPMSTREGLKGTTLSGGISVRESNTSVKARKGPRGDNNPIGGVSGSAFQGYAAPTYTPSMENSTYNVNISLNSSFSQTDPLSDGFPYGFGGYYSGQFLLDPVKHTPAYGYMYSGVSQDDNKLMDFNREKDGAYNEHTKNLAVTNFTHDIFQVSGQGPGSQGVSGAYRLHRNEIGAVHDASAIGKAYSPSIGADLGFGVPPSTKVGIDLGYNQTNTNSGKWTTGRQGIANFQNARQYEASNPGKELVFFKRVGEMTVDNDINFSSTVKGGHKVMNNGLKSSSEWLGDGELNGGFNYTSNGVAATMPVSGSKKSKRDFRNGSMMYLTAGELNGNSNKEIRPIESYPQNTFTWRQEKNNFRASKDEDVKVGYKPIQKTFDRVDNIKKSHHLSEFRVTGSTGARYIYGIPTYNHTQEEVTFATTAMPKGGPKEEKAYLKGLVDYTPDDDDSRKNKNGLDHMYSRVTTPAYANSFLLTSILSSDYVDRDNVKGPSDGDLGTYTKFNYTKAIDKYKWRTPYSVNGNEASFSEGLLGSDDDNKANYVYGEKEIWYMHSIETRTHVAEFYLSDREDGRGVDSKHGKIGGKKQKKLDKIVLYSKPDKFNSNPEVIKTVHFEYDYSLSPNTPNSTAANGGKLTLKKIWFTYGDSNKGILNPYEFNYARQRFTGVASTDKEPENRLNPPYSHKNYDRWGVYKPDYGTAAEKGKLNAEFPYTDPNKQQSDEYAAAYALTAIKSPTGGTTRVFYEADDYGYVQNRQAMRMFKVVGMSKQPENGVPQPELYPVYSNSFDNLIDYEYVVIDLEEGFIPSPASTTKALKNQEFQNKYLKDIDVMYYKFLIKVLEGASLGTSGRREFVRGYSEIEKDFSVLGVPQDGKYKTAYIKVKPTTIKSFGTPKKVLPMIKSGWLFAHTTLSRELMGSANADDGGLEQVLRSLLSMVKTISELTSSFSRSMMENFHSREFEPSRSFVRLNEPDKIKIGGGHRVKAVVMVDNWDIMVSDKEAADNEASKQLAAYGQHYDYSMIENGEVISSGVAAYEPVPGGDENPFRMPIFSKEKIPLAPDKESFVEEPFGEFAFPSPKVGYRKVTVKPLKVVNPNNPLNSIYEDDVIGKDADNNDIIADDGDDIGGEWISDTPLGNGTGKVVNEFYTAYDFPTKVRQTKLDVKRHKPKLLFKFLKFDNKDLVTCTQGYSVELNDMHGKQFKKSVYAETSDAVTEPEPISEIENLYKFTEDGKLSNEVTVINNDLSITREGSGAEFGVEVDVVQDERFYETTTIGGGLQFNLKWVQAGPIPIFVPTFFPDFTYDKTRFRSLVTTKIVNKYAISSGTIAKDNGAAITSKNLAWDAETGEVLITETQNEFHDPIYSFKYPGHWAYDRLKHAAQNEGLRFTKSNSSTAKQYLKDGDEFIVSGNSKVGFCFYDKPNDKLIDIDNNEVKDYDWMKLVRSGGRNMATTPIGSTTTLENPIAAGATKVNFEKVLNTSVNEFKDLWYEFCNCPEFDDKPHATENPFILGKRGNLRPWRNWAYLTNRTQTQWNNNLSVRNDGVFEEYTPFWQYSSTNKSLLAPTQTQLNNLKWQFVSQIEKYNAVGLAMEQVDALNRFTMAQYGYGKNLQVAGASNAEYREAGYDGFEDYDFADCEDDHFNFRTDKDADKVTEEEAHTGRKSIKVGPDGNVQMHRVIIPCNNYNAPSNRLKQQHNN